MTKKHFQRAAEIVNEIRLGQWTFDLPQWADRTFAPFVGDEGTPAWHYTRAVQTAEAFIVLFRAYNDRFDRQRFLVACGLIGKGKDR